MKNHYKSQLVIKRFNQKLWIYDLETRKLAQKQSHKILYEEDIYDADIEEKLHKLESDYSNIIDNYILEKEEIRITREQLYLIKKFLLVDSLRVWYGNGDFTKMFRSFEPSARRYFEIKKTYILLDPREQYIYECCKNKKYLSEINMSERDKFMMCLRVILDNDIFYLHQTDCPLDIIAWSVAMTESYLTFWDANEKEDFILSDTNMISEYDMCHMIYSGLNKEKISYLFEKAKGSKITLYWKLLETQTVMYENFNIFNLSKNRSIVCINPFFKLYSDRIFEFDTTDIKVDKPNIWCSSILHFKAFEIPKNEYKVDYHYFNHTSEDIFIYKPYQLTQAETIAINMLILNETKKIIGFADKRKAINTLEYANVAHSFYDASRARSNDLAGLEAMTKSLMTNAFYPIIKEITDEGIKGDINPFTMFEKNTYISKIGMESNYYMYESFVNELKTNKDINLMPFQFLIHQGITDLISYFQEMTWNARKLNKTFIEKLYKNQEKDDII